MHKKILIYFKLLPAAVKSCLSPCQEELWKGCNVNIFFLRLGYHTMKCEGVCLISGIHNKLYTLCRSVNERVCVSCNVKCVSHYAVLCFDLSSNLQSYLLLSGEVCCRPAHTQHSVHETPPRERSYNYLTQLNNQPGYKRGKNTYNSFSVYTLFFMF